MIRERMQLSYRKRLRYLFIPQHDKWLTEYRQWVRQAIYI